MGTVEIVIVCVVSGLVATLGVAFMRGREKKVLIEDLAARGITPTDGGGALDLPRSSMIIGAADEAVWSAKVGGALGVCLYRMNAGHIVAAWKSATIKQVAFALASPGGVGNPARKRFKEIPGKQLGVKGIDLYADSPDTAEWLRTTGVLTTFVRLYGEHNGWQFQYEAGVCYVFSYQEGWTGLASIELVVGQLDAALGANPGAAVA